MVIAESFERIHRSNLIGMGILPLEFPQGVTRKTLGLTGEEVIDIADLQNLRPGATIPVTLTRSDGSKETVPCRCRIDTATELTYYQNDGILHYVIKYAELKPFIGPAVNRQARALIPVAYLLSRWPILAALVSR